MNERSRWLARADWVGLALLLLLFLYESLVVLQTELRFTADSERDLFYVLGLTRSGILPADGIRMAALGIDLGPLYFLLISPLCAIWPSPQTVHLFNTLICTVGLAAFYTWARATCGRSAALIGVFLYSQSGAHGALVDTIWHVGATPGVALGMLAAMGHWARTGARWALVTSGVLLAILIQLHALGSVYVPAACLLLWWGRRHLNRRRMMWLGGAVWIALIPLLFYLLPSLGDPSEGASRHAGGFAFRPQAFWEGLFGLLQPRFLLAPGWTALLTLFLVALAIVSTGLRFLRSSEAGERPWFRVFLIVQLCVGATVVSLVLPYENVGRYFLPVVFPLFALATLGLGDVDQSLRRRGRPPLGRALTFAVLIGGLSLVGVPQTPLFPGKQEGADGIDYLSAEEQERVVSYLVRERGMTWPRMRGRVHGAFLGPLTGIRYLETVVRAEAATPNAEEREDHWVVLPAAMAAAWAPTEPLEVHTLTGRVRDIQLFRFAPRMDPGRVETERRTPCSWSFPYLWSEAPPDLLKEVGFPTGYGPDIHRCLGPDGGGTLVIPLPAEATELTLQLSDGGHFRADTEGQEGPIQAHLEASDAPDLPLALMPNHYSEKLWYRILLPPHDGSRELHLRLRARGQLGFIDLY